MTRPKLGYFTIFWLLYDSEYDNQVELVILIDIYDCEMLSWWNRNWWWRKWVKNNICKWNLPSNSKVKPKIKSRSSQSQSRCLRITAYLIKLIKINSLSLPSFPLSLLWCNKAFMMNTLSLNTLNSDPRNLFTLMKMIQSKILLIIPLYCIKSTIRISADTLISNTKNRSITLCKPIIAIRSKTSRIWSKTSMNINYKSNRNSLKTLYCLHNNIMIPIDLH